MASQFKIEEAVYEDFLGQLDLKTRLKTKREFRAETTKEQLEFSLHGGTHLPFTPDVESAQQVVFALLKAFSHNNLDTSFVGRGTDLEEHPLVRETFYYLYMACVLYLSDYAAPSDRDFYGIYRLICIDRGRDQKHKTGFDLIFQELSTGKRKIRTGSGLREIDSPLIRRSNKVQVANRQKFNPRNDFSYGFYQRYKNNLSELATRNECVDIADICLTPFVEMRTHEHQGHR